MTILTTDIDGCIARGMERALQHGLYCVDGSGMIGEFETRSLPLFPPGYVVAANSGTSAATELYWGLGIGPGDDVLIPAYGFHATVLPLLRLGAVPRFVDVASDGMPSEAAIEAAWTPRTRACVFTHLWGPLFDLTKISERVHSLGGLLIADCSHSLATAGPRLLAGEKCDGAFASLNQLKPVGVGEGGISWVPRRDAADRVIAFGHGGARGRNLSDAGLRELGQTGLGEKHRITVVAAAIGIERLDALETMRHRRWTRGLHFARALSATGLVRPLFDLDAPTPIAFHHVPFAMDQAAGADISRVRHDLAAAGLPVIQVASTRPLADLPVLRQADWWFPHINRSLVPRDYPGARGYADTLLLFTPEELVRPRTQGELGRALLQNSI